MPEKHRVDHADVVKDFRDQLKDSGGGPRIYEKAVDAKTRELFGGSVQELYEGVGGKTGDRNTLPHSAQNAYMHNEIDCTQQLKRQGRQPGNQGRRDRTIVNTVRERSKKNKRLWEWNR